MPMSIRRALKLFVMTLVAVFSGCQNQDAAENRADTAAISAPAAVEPAWRQVVPDDPSAKLCSIELGAEQQVFHGFGTSMLQCNAWTASTPLDIHRRLARAAWGEGGLRVLRTWLYLPETISADRKVDISNYVKRYIDSRLIAEACAAGCTGIVIAPAKFPPHLCLAAREDVTPVINGHKEQRMVSDANLAAMMEATAEAICQIHQRHGIAIAATGIQNEPNQDHGDSGYITVAQTPLAVKTLRRALDARNLQSVAIIAPETSSVDWAFDDRVAALRADGEAWAALGGIAWHSYNMAMIPTWAAALRASGKELWMTEASANGPESPNDRVAAASMAARIANDMRYGAGRWIWFLGYEGHDPKDDQTRLVRIFQDRTPVTFEELGKFHPLQDLCAAFPPGSKVLATESPELRAWTYGRKPALQAVAARRGDGQIAIAAVNYTATTFPAADAKGSFDLENAGLPAETLRLDVHLPCTSGVAKVRRREADLAKAIDEVLPVRDGRLIVVLRPLEILTAVIEAREAKQ